MQRSNNRRRAYRRRQQQRKAIIIAAAAIAIIAVIVLILVLRPSGTDKPGAVLASTTTSPTPTIDPDVTPTPTPTVAPSPTPSNPYAANAVYRPSAEDGFLPVFKQANTQEKIIAITVDDCFQAENLRTIVQTAIDNGGKLTIFPIGSVALRDEQSQILKWAWENGMELENHTYSHNGLYGVTNERLAKEMYMQNLAISKILNVEYQGHFIRPRGGDAKDDQRIHAYAEQIGYYGVAHWNVSGSGTKMRDLPGVLKPGAIYLFHTTDDDLAKLLRFIPYAVQQGYKLVTLNEMFGYPENETKPLTKEISEYTVPELKPYDVKPVVYKQTSYAYGVTLIQQKLIALGYLQGEADGVYGPNCAMAVTKFQQDNALPVTGEADVATQEKLEEAYQKSLGMNL